MSTVSASSTLPLRLTQQTSPLAAALLWWLIALVFLRPWDYLPALASARPLSLMIFAVALAWLLNKPQLRLFADLPSKPLWLTFALIVGLSPFSYWPTMSSEVAFEFLQGIAIFVLITHLVTTAKQLAGMTRLIVACCVLHGAYATYAYLTSTPSADKRVFGMGQGVFYDPNDLALSLVMIFPLSWWCFRSAASGYRRFLAFLGMLTIVGGIMAAQSRGGLLALGAAVCVLGYRSRNSLTPLAATLALTAAAVLVVFPSGVFDRYASILQYQTDESAVARLAVWKAGLQMFADHPLTGVGAGAFETVYGMYYIDREGAGNIWRAAHSSYIEVAAELGIFGLLAWLAVLASGFFTLVRARRALSMSEPAFDEQRELSNWVDAATASLVSFLVGGMFLSRAYDVGLIILLAMASVALRVSLSAHADAIDEADGDAAETPPSSD